MVTMETTTTERDARVQILNAFLTSPHGKLAGLAPLHADALARDPLFYSHLALWYMERGEVRDHKTLFVAHLLTCAYPEFREAGWVLLQELAPFEVARVLDHAKQVIGKAPRVLRSAVAHYLRTREQNPAQFDGAAMRARRHLKHLYACLRLKPAARAQAILFDERPPADSRLAAMKLLAKAETAEAQAQLILDHKIPYLVAIGAVRHVAPALLVALIQAMTPQEVINNLAALKRRGALDNAEVKALIDQKLQAATADKRVSTLKAKRAMAAADLDEATERTLVQVVDSRVAHKVEVKRPTALFVDKSGSMAQAIEVAKQLAALISAVVSADFHVYTFDTVAMAITAEANGADRPALSQWEAAFKYVKADGGTSIGAPLAKMRKDGVYVEQIVLVTDEGENTPPFFADAWAEYASALHASPTVIIVHVGGAYSRFSSTLQARGIEVLTYQFDGDYYSLPNVLPLLTMPTRAELVELILERPLPRRPERRVTSDEDGQPRRTVVAGG